MTSRALLATFLLGLLTLPLLASTADSAPAAHILCYHIVESPQDPRMEIGRDAFRQQMRYLAYTGYNVIPLRWVYEYVSGKRASIPKNSVVITIDDGWRSTYTEVFPEMQARKFPFTVFIYPRIIGQTAYALTWKQVREMSDAGVDIQSHTLSHPFLTQRRHSSLSDDEYHQWLTRELTESRRILERETGKKVDFLAYPYGDYDHTVAAACNRAGYVAALTCEFGGVRRGSDPFRMKRFVIDKRMDFASFRRYMGASPLRIEETAPATDVVEPEQPMTISARIANHQTIDPTSVRMTLLTSGIADNFSYDPRDGSITMIVKDAIKAFQGRAQRALIWATDAKTGKRLEATWTIRAPLMPAPPAPVFVEDGAMPRGQSLTDGAPPEPALQTAKRTGEPAAAPPATAAPTSGATHNAEKAHPTPHAPRL